MTSKNENIVEIGDMVRRVNVNELTSMRLGNSSYNTLRRDVRYGDNLIVTQGVMDKPDLFVCVRPNDDAGEPENSGVFSRDELAMVEKSVIMVASAIETDQILTSIVELLRVFPNRTSAVRFNSGDADEFDATLINENVPKLRKLLASHPQFRRRETERRLTNLSIQLADAENDARIANERVRRIRNKLDR